VLPGHRGPETAIAHKIKLKRQLQQTRYLEELIAFPFSVIITTIVGVEAMLHQIRWHNCTAPEVTPHIHREVPAPKVAESEDVALREPAVLDESV
jgi:hypothetical protein